jgi:trimeric autotransporter adhesin
MEQRIARFLVGFLSLALSLVPLTVAQTATQPASAVPRLVRFNGTAKDFKGNPLTGVVGITFSFYSEQTGAALWLETQNVTADGNGHYTVLLGSTKPDGLPPELFTSEQAHWLGVQISGQEEQPRVLLVSAPYALKAGDAETLGGLPPSAFALAGTGTTAAKTTITTSARSSTSIPSVAASPSSTSNVTTTGGTLHALPMFTTAANIQNSIVTESSSTSIDVAGKLGIDTSAPAESLDVTSGNAIIRGVGNFKANGDAATLYIGDTNHPIQARYSDGLAVGAFKAPTALFIADFTGNVGIGTTTPTTGILNTAANTKSVIALSTVGWNAASGSKLGGTDAIHATGGSGDTTSGIGVVATGGTGNVGTLNGTGGAGIVSVGGNTGVGPTAAAAGIIATGGNNTNIGFGGSPTGGSGGAGVSGTGGTGQLSPVPGGAGGTFVGGAGCANSTRCSGFFIDGDGIDATNADGGTNEFSGAYAGNFSGDVNVSGMLSKAGGSFKIDYPLDPANQYLYHSFVESPDMKNIYDGVAILDANGEAVIEMADWFSVLNRDFRYQLTPIGKPSPGLYIAEEMSGNHFKIAGGTPGTKVSWQVTGIRQDAWADAHRIPVVEKKNARERGFYIHPELYGQPEEKQIEWARHPQMMRNIQETRAKQLAASQKQTVPRD